MTSYKQKEIMWPEHGVRILKHQASSMKLGPGANKSGSLFQVQWHLIPRRKFALRKFRMTVFTYHMQHCMSIDSPTYMLGQTDDDLTNTEF